MTAALEEVEHLKEVCAPLEQGDQQSQEEAQGLHLEYSPLRGLYSRSLCDKEPLYELYVAYDRWTNAPMPWRLPALRRKAL